MIDLLLLVISKVYLWFIKFCFAKSKMSPVEELLDEDEEEEDFLLPIVGN